jgi:predicted ATP-grasp superfamily ATP-dependent carboligase
VGSPWLHAAPFRYCGSIGPLEPEERLRRELERLGEELAGQTGLRGLFGVDGILRDGAFWPVEVNPRYTASVEVLEHATGLPALALHREVFVGQAACLSSSRKDRKAACPTGKAVLFARQGLRFPRSGPWREVLRAPPPVDEMPGFADLPYPESPIEAGRPVLTLFARAGTLAECEERLRRSAAELDRWLYGGAAVG